MSTLHLDFFFLLFLGYHLLFINKIILFISMFSLALQFFYSSFLLTMYRGHFGFVLVFRALN